MRKVTLIFPDITSISEFILTYKVSKALVNSNEKMLKAVVSSKILDMAVKGYGAKIKESIEVKSFG